MAPGRKRGAKGVKTMSDLSIGDLVLAKVKGFPAWPAKVWSLLPFVFCLFVQTQVVKNSNETCQCL